MEHCKQACELNWFERWNALYRIAWFPAFLAKGGDGGGFLIQGGAVRETVLALSITDLTILTDQSVNANELITANTSGQ